MGSSRELEREAQLPVSPMTSRSICAVRCGAVQCCAVRCGAVRCCAVMCCAVLCCAVLCCVCCAVGCCAVRCGVVLCSAVLCCAVLCCAVLCCAVWSVWDNQQRRYIKCIFHCNMPSNFASKGHSGVAAVYFILFNLNFG